MDLNLNRFALDTRALEFNRMGLLLSALIDASFATENQWRIQPDQGSYQ